MTQHSCVRIEEQIDLHKKKNKLYFVKTNFILKIEEILSRCNVQKANSDAMYSIPKKFDCSKDIFGI